MNVSWKECDKCGGATRLRLDFCPYCGMLYGEMDSSNESELRNKWKQALLRAAKQGRYVEVLRGLAANTGNRGNIFGFIEDFCENADPWNGEDEGR